MKNILCLIIVCLWVHVSKAQFNLNLAKDSTLTGSVYAGIIGISSFSVDSPKVSFAAPIRLGAALKWNPKGVFSFHTFGSYDISSGVMIGRFSARISRDWWGIDAGYMPTVSTLYHRPYPLSGFGQFEPRTKSLVPGAGTGVVVSITPKKSPVSFEAGASLRSQFSIEYHAGITINGKIKISGWAIGDSLGGAAISYNGEKVIGTIACTQKDIALFSNVKVYKNLSVYCDLGIGSWFPGNKNGESSISLVRGEGGVLKTFSYKLLSGLIGIGYAHETKTVKGYLFLHL